MHDSFNLYIIFDFGGAVTTIAQVHTAFFMDYRQTRAATWPHTKKRRAQIRTEE